MKLFLTFFAFFPTLSSSAWAMTETTKYVGIIMEPPPTLEIPRPVTMNEGIDEIDFLITMRNLENANKMTGPMYRELFYHANDKINHFITQLTLENAPGFCDTRRAQLRKYRDEIIAKHLNHTLSVNTLILLGIKLCFFADFCRVDITKNFQARMDFRKLRNPNLANLFSLEALEKFPRLNGGDALDYYGIIAIRSFDELESYMCNLPVIPFIAESAAFGINTFLYAFAKGFLILGFPVRNTSPSHGGMMRSFKSAFDYMALVGPIAKLATYELDYDSSLVGVAHDLTHLQGIRNMINPALQYYELFRANNLGIPAHDNSEAIASAKHVITCYRSLYITLMAQWDRLERPQHIALFLFWLVHECNYGERKGEVGTVIDLIDGSLIFDQRKDMLIAQDSVYHATELSLKQLDQTIRRIIYVNEIDFAISLDALGPPIDWRHNSLEKNLTAIRSAFIDAYNASPDIKNLVDAIKYNESHFFGAPFKIVKTIVESIGNI